MSPSEECPPLTLCGACRGIGTLANGVQQLRSDYELHNSLRNLNASAETCPLCRMFSNTLERFGQRAGIHFQTSKSTDGIGVRAIFGSASACVWHNRPTVMGLRLFWQSLHVGSFVVNTTESDPVPIDEVTIAHSFKSYPMAKVNISQVKDWTSACLDSHEDCKSGEIAAPEVLLPPRLVKVDEDGCYLYEPQEGELGHYLTLSYNWGGSLPLITTAQNIAELKIDIPEAQLAKTIQDAVTVTRLLGYDYLWVDSLCVVQDDHEDWAKSASELSAIFSNSSLCITAETATSALEGFLHPYVSVQRVRVEYLTPSGQTSALLIDEEPQIDDRDEDTAIPVSSLQKRGWVFQERSLSTRLLRFAHRSVFWECRARFASNTGIDVKKKRKDPVGSFGGHHNKLGEVTGQAQTGELYYQWSSTVHEYSKRKTTYHSDRLPALASIARHFAPIMNDQYLAGLWRQHLPEMLAWWIRPCDLNTSRQILSQIPSWSWAAVDGPVQMPIPRNQRRIPCAEILDVDCQPLGDDEYGNVRPGGKLSVKGLILPVRCRRIEQALESGQTSDSPFCVMLPGSQTSLGSCSWDFKDGRRTKTVAMATDLSGDSTLEDVAILLNPVAANVYQRVGVTWLPSGHFENLKPSTITIV